MLKHQLSQFFQRFRTIKRTTLSGAVLIQHDLILMTDSTLQKLEKISDAEFAELELYPDF